MTDDPLSTIAAAAEEPMPAPDLRQGEQAGGDEHDVIHWPSNAPVTPLGHLKKTLYFLDADGQLIEENGKLDERFITYLFGLRVQWVVDKFPMFKMVQGEKGEKPVFVPDGFKFHQPKVQRALIQACRKKGLLDISGKVRGRGSHRGKAGELILHCGDRVLTGGQKIGARVKKPVSQKPGQIGDLIFPTAPALPRPAETPATADQALRLLTLFDRWNWQSASRIEIGAVQVRIEAVIVLGWLICAKGCGAIDWRPHMWLVGPSGAGKSTLLKLISGLLADWALESDDPSEAWINQKLIDQRLPVLYDEPEPDADANRFVKQIILLARRASVGGSKGRGSADHNAKEFVAYSCFLFASILHHELAEQDRNRMAIPKLAPFPANTAKLNMAKALKELGLPASVQELGLALTRRLLDQWPRYDHTLLVYQAELMEQGFTQREMDTYGQMLCAADLMLFDETPDPTAMHEADRVKMFVKATLPMVSVARAEAEDTSQRCLKRLQSYRLPSAKGQHQETISRWVHKALEQVMLREYGSDEAKMKLASHGMLLVHCDKPDGESGAVEAELGPFEKKVYLAVAYKTHAGMAEIFNGSDWSGGIWTQALGALPGAIAAGKQVRFKPDRHRSVLVPIDLMVDAFAAAAEADRERKRRQEADANRDEP